MNVFERSATFADAPATIYADNDAVIAVAHARKALHLADCGHALPGELVFPMMVRGELNGLLMLSCKLSGPNFRGDEIALLTTAVHQIALDLEGLRVAALELDAVKSARKLRDVQHQLVFANEKAELAERMATSFRQEFLAAAR